MLVDHNSAQFLDQGQTAESSAALTQDNDKIVINVEE
jgi:hypothetical protein